jgi:hypothetical protein
MSDRIARLFAEARFPLTIAVMALATVVVATGPAWPQAPKPPPAAAASDPAPQGSAAPTAPDQAAPQPTEPAPPPGTENRGLFNEIGKLFDNPSSLFPNLPNLPTLKSPKETFDDLNARAKDASDGLSRLTTTPSVVRGRVACPVANGAPDCKAASDKLCQTKGFKEGKSLDTDQAQACSAAALLSGGNREPGNCRTENYVTRALCQ